MAIQSGADQKDRTKAVLSCREASKADLPAILTLFAQPDLDNGEILPLFEAEPIFERMAHYPHYTLYVAVYGDHVIGTYALLIMDNLGHLGAPSAVIEDVAVDPAWQGRGVGTMMMNRALEIASAKGGMFKQTTQKSHRV